MFKINEDKSIYLTRGDTATFTLTAMNGSEPYIFVVGDTVRINVFEKKACHRVVLQKDFRINEASDNVVITLTSEETKIGDIVSKPVDYWYEVELNPETLTQTIIGYDEDGGKVFRLFPEGGEE